MYACICNAVTDNQVRHAAQHGVRDLRGLQAHLGIALGCGRCASYAHGLLRDSVKTQTTKPQCNKDCANCPCSMERL
jgi:bacterioferritin-associated ferredoxin